MQKIRIGVQSGGTDSTQEIRATAAKAEALGVDSVWIVEDYFYTGGIAGVLAAMEATSRISIGTGILATQTRHPALLAMEVATITALYPGRFNFGIGLGVVSWLRQMGISPKSPIGATTECVAGLRALFNGEKYSAISEYFEFNDVQLIHPPTAPIPIHIGAMNNRMIELTGSIADGFVAGNTAGPKFVEHAKGLMRSSAHKNGRDLDHGITCYVVFSVDDDSAVARQAVRPLVGFYLGICGKTAHVDVYDYTDHLLQLLDAGGVEYVQANFPDSWLDELAVAGTPAECAAQINRFEAAGVDTLVLLPQPNASATQVLEKAALEVLPLIA